MKKLLLLLSPLFLNAQNVPIGNWKNHLSYKSAAYISITNERIYCVANNGLFYINKSDGSIIRLSKVNGLSDIDVKQIASSDEEKVSVISYKNCNVDLIRENSIINISDIKRKEIIGNKSINNITIEDNVAYLSCSFGLVLIDLDKNEIKDTYNIGEGGNYVEINGCAFKEDTIFTATSNGIYFANKNSTSLFDYNSWSIYNTANIWVDNIVASENQIFIDSSSYVNNIYADKNVFFEVFDTVVYIYNSDFSIEHTITSPIISNAKYACKDSENNIWIADSVNGLLKFTDLENYELFVPQGPNTNDIYSLEFLKKQLFVCHGGHTNFGENHYSKTGASIMQNNYYWKTEDYYRLGYAWDVLAVAVDNEKEYYASWYDGVSVLDATIKEDEYRYLKQFVYENTEGVLDTSWTASDRIRVSDLKIDKYGNLWGLNSEVNHPLFVKTYNEKWHAFSMGQSMIDLFFDDLLIDYWGQKWGIIGRKGGVFVYNDNNTISDLSDDQFNILTTNIGDGGLPSEEVYSITQDLSNTIWIGTNQGVAVFFNPSLVFSGNNFDAQQILIQEGEYGQYLLSEEKVKSIAVDGANRKWIGTEKSGVFLLSEDGAEEILHFTTNNSPLFSNNIIDITLNNETGEVFIGTSKGLLSYRSDATTGSESQSNTHVFPNPVRESYYGPIAIRGLVKNANVKITDIHGNIVFEDFAKGGQAIWDGKNKKNEKASTGIYLVFSSDINGVEKIVSKILLIK